MANQKFTKSNKNIIYNNSMKEINKTYIKYECKETGEGEIGSGWEFLR